MKKQLELARENGLVAELGKQASAQFRAKERGMTNHDIGATSDIKAATPKRGTRKDPGIER